VVIDAIEVGHAASSERTGGAAADVSTTGVETFGVTPATSWDSKVPMSAPWATRPESPTGTLRRGWIGWNWVTCGS